MTNPEIATLENPSCSPSGNYFLVVKKIDFKNQPCTYFIIQNQQREDIYTCQDKFSLRDTTFILWDQNDRVWVYSGDVGTYFWEQQGTGEWKKYSYVRNNIPAPEFLKRERPKWHKK